MTTERVMLLIDADNVSLDVMEQAVRLVLQQHGALHVRRAYCTAESAVKHQAMFKHLGIKPMVNLAAGKNSTDIAMAVDAIDLVLAERPDVVVIASSDSDFAPLVQRLREKGCVVRGIGQSGKTGDETKDVYDDYTVLEHRPTAAARRLRTEGDGMADGGPRGSARRGARKTTASKKPASKDGATSSRKRSSSGRDGAARPAATAPARPAATEPLRAATAAPTRAAARPAEDEADPVDERFRSENTAEDTAGAAAAAVAEASVTPAVAVPDDDPATPAAPAAPARKTAARKTPARKTAAKTPAAKRPATGRRAKADPDAAAPAGDEPAGVVIAADADAGADASGQGPAAVAVQASPPPPASPLEDRAASAPPDADRPPREPRGRRSGSSRRGREEGSGDGRGAADAAGADAPPNGGPSAGGGQGGDGQGGAGQNGGNLRATSLQAVLDCLPELQRGQGLALNVAVQRLRESRLLGRNTSSLKLFSQWADRFELLPPDKPAQVRLRAA